jgi:hypothetical protein
VEKTKISEALLYFFAQNSPMKTEYRQKLNTNLPIHQSSKKDSILVVFLAQKDPFFVLAVQLSLTVRRSRIEK